MTASSKEKKHPSDDEEILRQAERAMEEIYMEHPLDERPKRSRYVTYVGGNSEAY